MRFVDLKICKTNIYCDFIVYKSDNSLLVFFFTNKHKISFSSVPAEKLLAGTNLRLLSPGFFWYSTSSLRKCFTRQMFLDVSLNSSYLSDLVSESESQIVIVWILS